jgi:site-specific DNA-adenine methylase
VRTQSPIAYPGSKARLIARCEPLFPPHRHHISVFGGACQEILAKQKISPCESHNDLDEGATNFFQQVRDNCAALIRRIRVNEYSRDRFLECERRLREGTASNLEFAECYLVVGMQSQPILTCYHTSHTPAVVGGCCFLMGGK